MNPSTFDLSGTPIAPGDCGDFSVTLNGVGSHPEVCFMISTHEADPTVQPDAACCYLEHCVEVPPCDSDCATLSLFDSSYCDEDGHHLEFGISNNAGYTFGQLQMSYPGQSGTIVQWVTGLSILPMTSGILNVDLDPDLRGGSPFCIDLIFYEDNASGELIECCHLPWCIELPPCDEDLFGCTDPAARTTIRALRWTTAPASTMNPEGPADPNYPAPRNTNRSAAVTATPIPTRAMPSTSTASNLTWPLRRWRTCPSAAPRTMPATSTRCHRERRHVRIPIGWVRL